MDVSLICHLVKKIFFKVFLSTVILLAKLNSFKKFDLYVNEKL